MTLISRTNWSISGHSQWQTGLTLKAGVAPLLQGVFPWWPRSLPCLTLVPHNPPFQHVYWIRAHGQFFSVLMSLKLFLRYLQVNVSTIPSLIFINSWHWIPFIQTLACFLDLWSSQHTRQLGAPCWMRLWMALCQLKSSLLPWNVWWYYLSSKKKNISELNLEVLGNHRHSLDLIFFFLWKSLERTATAHI